MAKMENGLSSVTIRCSYNKRWTLIPTTCEVERCGPFELVENARLVAYNNSVDGLAKIKCHNSYRFADGARTKAFRCLASLSWQPRERCYLNVCPQLQPLENGLLSTDIAIEGTVVEVKCLPGFVFPDRKTTKFITCNSSFLWSDLPEHCQDIRCPEPPEITYGNRTSTDRLYNSTVTYTCHGSYRLQYGYQQTTIRCGENAEWTYSKLSCGDDRCPPVKSVENATPSTYLAINGTIVIYTCNEGYIFPNNETTLAIYCDGEKWNNTARACIKVICPELHLTHAITYGNGRSFGDVITFECYEGYVYNNNISGVLRCTANARWSTDTDGCTAVDCGAPPEVTYSIHYIPPSHHYGTNITYRCISNYWFKRGTTTKVITCTRYAKWSDISGHCTPITCHPIPIWNDLEANTTQNVVGTVASVRCTRDDVNRTIISTCSDYGEWEPPLDNCKTETIGVFEPEPEEATGAGGIGLIVTGVMVLLCTVLVISDAQAIIQALKGQALKTNLRNNH